MLAEGQIIYLFQPIQLASLSSILLDVFWD
jgi:hypothetical protein